jgi:hypothetical protein
MKSQTVATSASSSFTASFGTQSEVHLPHHN